MRNADNIRELVDQLFGVRLTFAGIAQNVSSRNPEAERTEAEINLLTAFVHGEYCLQELFFAINPQYRHDNVFPTNPVGRMFRVLFRRDVEITDVVKVRRRIEDALRKLSPDEEETLAAIAALLGVKTNVE